MKLSKKLREGSTDDKEYLEKAYSYCTETIKNIYNPKSGYTEEDREKLKENLYPKHTIKRGYGTSYDINNLFASLAAAGGDEVHFADCERRDFYRFRKEVIGPQNLSDTIIGVGKGDEFNYFLPGEFYMPFGWIPAANRNAVFLFGEPKKTEFYITPGISSEKSQSIRKAELRMLENGDIAGSVSIQYGGYEGLWRKRWLDDKTPDQCREWILEQYQERLPSLVLDNFVIKNIHSWTNDLEISFDVNIPAYGEKAGSRVFLVPGFFVKGEENLFKEEERLFNIEQQYPFQVHDEIWITLPEGYELEEAAAPGLPIETPVLGYRASIGVSRKTNRILYKRLFRSDYLILSVEHYSEIKTLYDEMHRQDQHELCLKKVPHSQ